MERGKHPNLPVFRPGESDLEKALGTLESQVMEVVWSGDDMPVDAVREKLSEKGKQAAYTTVMTTLDRLFKKGYLDRRRVGKAYHYSARVTKHELGRSVARQVLDGLLTSFAEPAIAYFVEALGRSQPDKLDALAQQISEEKIRRERDPDAEKG
jgi:predicted transcriptional regulator